MAGWKLRYWYCWRHAPAEKSSSFTQAPRPRPLAHVDLARDGGSDEAGAVFADALDRSFHGCDHLIDCG